MDIQTQAGTQHTTYQSGYGLDMRFGVLGTVELAHDGQRLSLGGPKQQTVPALLIANLGRPVSTDTLVHGVYGDEQSAGSRRSVQTYVSNLRAELGDVIKAAGHGHTLDAAHDEVDALVFGDLVEQAATAQDPDESSTQLHTNRVRHVPCRSVSDT